jgi:hypothetical protein
MAISVITGNSTGSSGTVLTTGNPQSGGVIQTVYGRISDNRYSTTSTSWVSLGVTLSITPKFATSKILVRYVANATISANSSADGRFDVVRNSTQNLSGFSTGIQSISGNPSTTNFGTIVVEYLDSPATTSAITYGASVQVDSSSYTLYFNDNSASTGTSFVLMEIAA